MNVLATLATILGLALLFGLRFLGLYSHQAFALVVIIGLLWAVVSRLWLWRKKRLRWRSPAGLRDLATRPHAVDALARALFWLALGTSALAVFPRSAEMVPLIGAVSVLVALRVAASFLGSDRRNPATTIAMALAAIVLLVDLGRGFIRRAEPVITLAPPFQGEWIVLQGGPSPMQSHHLSAFNQEYAVDLMKLDDSGKLFIDGQQGNASSASWEQRLLSPVDGRVVVAESSIDDAEGVNLVKDEKQAAGNVVVIEAAPNQYVVLAHLRKGSVKVAVGDHVDKGQEIALCGNSGNSTGAHLHLQVQTHVDLWHPDNRSLPFAFVGESEPPVRNDRVRGASN